MQTKNMQVNQKQESWWQFGFKSCLKNYRTNLKNHVELLKIVYKVYDFKISPVGTVGVYVYSHRA